MDISLEQAKAFDFIAKYGTAQAAAKAMNKGHSAVLYLIKCLEEQTQLSLFDRSGYRNQISPAGEVVLRYCRQLLETRQELDQACHQLRSGWEPRLKLVYDAVIDFKMIGDALYNLGRLQHATQVQIIGTYLDEVETQFHAKKADLMLTILPIHQPNFLSFPLTPIQMLLVAHKDHPLAKTTGSKIPLSELVKHSFVQVREVTHVLGLSTEQLEFSSLFVVNDFATKKLAILKKLAYGWLPAYLIEKELRSKALVVLKTQVRSDHVLKPHLYHRRSETLGKTTQALLEFIKAGDQSLRTPS